MANAFVNTASGYTFDCSLIKDTLSTGTDTNANGSIEVTESKLYRKLSGSPIGGGTMPRNKGDNSGGDGANDGNLTYGTPLRDAQRNPVTFSKTDVGSDADPSGGADLIPDKGTQLRALMDWYNGGGACD